MKRILKSVFGEWVFVLVYSLLKQNEQLLFHVEKNGGLDGELDTTYTLDI